MFGKGIIYADLAPRSKHSSLRLCQRGERGKLLLLIYFYLASRRLSIHDGIVHHFQETERRNMKVDVEVESNAHHYY